MLEYQKEFAERIILTCVSNIFVKCDCIQKSIISIQIHAIYVRVNVEDNLEVNVEDNCVRVIKTIYNFEQCVSKQLLVNTENKYIDYTFCRRYYLELKSMFIFLNIQ